MDVYVASISCVTPVVLIFILSGCFVFLNFCFRLCLMFYFGKRVDHDASWDVVPLYRPPNGLLHAV